jgi:hypothetical protein
VDGIALLYRHGFTEVKVHAASKKALELALAGRSGCRALPAKDAMFV